MANIKNCPGFETFGADVKEARKVKQLSRKTLAAKASRKAMILPRWASRWH